jgi:hypothetical protein
MGSGIGVSGPRIGVPNVEVDINGPRIGGGIDIHGPAIGLPNVQVDINAPKIGGDIDIHGPSIGGEAGIKLKAKAPPKKIPNIEIKNTPVNVSLNKADGSVSGSDLLPSLNTIIDSEAPEVKFTSNINLQGATLPDPKASASLSVKAEATESPVSFGGVSADVHGTALLNNLISTDDKKGGKDKSGKKEVLKAGKKSSKGLNLGVSAHANVDVGKGKLSVRPSIKDTAHAKAKEVSLPGKILKMKELISLPCKDPIHEVKEMPKFEIYKRK